VPSPQVLAVVDECGQKKSKRHHPSFPTVSGKKNEAGAAPRTRNGGHGFRYGMRIVGPKLHWD